MRDRTRGGTANRALASMLVACAALIAGCASRSPVPGPAPEPRSSPTDAPADAGTGVDAPAAVDAPAPADTPAPAGPAAPAASPPGPIPVADDADPAAGEAIPGEAPQVPVPPTRRQLCTRPEAPDANMVDDVRSAVEKSTCATALWLDGLFGESRNLDSARRTSGYLETSVRHSEFEGTDEKVRFRVRVRLPNLKNRVSAVVGRDNEDDVVRDRTERFAVRAVIPQIDDDESWLAGLGYSFPGNERLKIDSRVGTSGVSRPRVYAQQRASWIALADANDLVYLRGTAFWTNRQGFGTTVGFDYTRVLGERFLLRVTDVGTVSEKTEGLDWFSGLILYQNLRKGRGLAYELLIRGQTDEPEPLYEYGGRLVYRHPLLPRRLIGEVLAGYSWPRVDPALDREGSAQVGISLEMPFGGAEP